MNASEVAQYLEDHPEFFEEHMELLSNIKLKLPGVGRAIPLVERQVASLRDKSQKLEGTLRDLVNFGEQNDLTSERMHRMTLALLAAPDMLSLLQTIDSHLGQEFGLDASAVRVWGGGEGSIVTEHDSASEQAVVFGEGLKGPQLSAQPLFETALWFGNKAAGLASYAYVPLRAEQPFGILVLASKDPARFTPDMGTLYIQRLGELVSMALRRFLEF
ncbi:MAG: DUF484 family protein [Burkholderiales bacterium]